MPYEWNPLWPDIVDPGNADYTAAVRRMVVASINWLAEHPDAMPEWRERSREAIARAAGLPPGASVVVTGAWEDMYSPSNSYARHWFRAMSDACGKGSEAPSVYMMDKAVACGMLFKSQGWDQFNSWMLTGGETRH